MQISQADILTKIQTLCPSLTNEVVDLLFQYFVQVHHNKMMNDFNILRNDKSFQNIIDSIIDTKS